jgi:hypothetical protein
LKRRKKERKAQRYRQTQEGEKKQIDGKGVGE